MPVTRRVGQFPTLFCAQMLIRKWGRHEINYNMALIQCKECGATISDKAKVCPRCGYPMEGTTNTIGASNEEKDKNVSITRISKIKAEQDKYVDRLSEPQKMFTNLFSCKGRVRRMELWIFQGLFLTVFFIFMYFATFFPIDKNVTEGIIFILSILWGWISLCQIIKRFHDRNMSGWNIFCFYVPIYNAYLIFMLFFVDGNPYENDYGPDPKGRNVESVKKYDEEAAKTDIFGNPMNGSST